MRSIISRPLRRTASTAFKQKQRVRWSSTNSKRDISDRYFQVSEEVREAVHSKRPVVALETTIYTHGWPHPDNVRLATHLERVIRDNGAVPATIGILDGVAHVGLNDKQIARLLEKPDVLKISRRDFGFALGSGPAINGGTTISGTMVLAHLAGIKVFATGGLGGVHKGGQDTMDISADLTELGRTPVAVIPSGCKGFLDIPRTLECLETQGASVATFADGRDGEVDFPAFWSRDSGSRSPMVVNDERHAAEMIHAHCSLGLTSGLLLANPVPAEHSIPRAEIENIIHHAIDLANRSGAHGSANTPFVLNAMKELSGGKTVSANWALVESNVKRGAKVANHLSELERRPDLSATLSQPALSRPVVDPQIKPTPLAPSIDHSAADSDVLSPKVNIIVAGSVAIDTSCDYRPLLADKGKTPKQSTSNPADITRTVGGVGFNVARAAKLVGGQVKLCSVVGRDAAGKQALDKISESGLALDGVHVLDTEESRTAQYVAMNDADKNLTLAMADMKILERPAEEFQSRWKPHLDSLEIKNAQASTKWLIVDANWDSRSLHKWHRNAKDKGIATAFEPVSVEKSTRIFESHTYGTDDQLRIVDLAAPNVLELLQMHKYAQSKGLMEHQQWWETIDALGIPATGVRSELVSITSQKMVDEGIPQQSIRLLPFIPNLITKLGREGVLVTRVLPIDDPLLSTRSPYVISRSKIELGGIRGLYMRLIPPERVLSSEEIVSVNGAGDTFLGVLVTRLAQKADTNLDASVMVAQRASALTLKSAESVSAAIQSL